MSDYAPSYPHDPIEQINDRLFIVRGSIQMNPLVRITRNMSVIRDGSELTLVNPLRMNAEGERQLKELGEVKRVLRTGPMHGLDDPWYVDQFGAEMWANPEGEIYTQPEITHTLDADTTLPFPDAELFWFEGVNQPEAALLLHDGEGILIACDAVQHYGDYSNNNLLARLLMPFIGFPKRTLVGPVWLNIQTPEGGDLRPQFDRLLELEFDAFFSAHGTWLPTGAKANVKRAIELAFK